MKAKTILTAIEAMRDMQFVTYTTSPSVWAVALTKLLDAEIELKLALHAELQDIAVEPVETSENV